MLITWQEDIVKEQEVQDQGELYSVGKEGVRSPPGHGAPGDSDNVSGSLEPWRGQSKELR